MLSPSAQQSFLQYSAGLRLEIEQMSYFAVLLFGGDTCKPIILEAVLFVVPFLNVPASGPAAWISFASHLATVPDNRGF